MSDVKIRVIHTAKNILVVVAVRFTSSFLHRLCIALEECMRRPGHCALRAPSSLFLHGLAIQKPHLTLLLP